MKQLRDLLKDLLEDRVFQAEKTARTKITMHIDPWCVGAGIAEWREESERGNRAADQSCRALTITVSQVRFK